ncbi:MAG: glycosyltransferase, partial [Alistipes sp.]|nr:glycosyltransferase [Alistipes sp.]
MKFSVIVPVYNRPGEVDELLESLAGAIGADMEVIVVEDGSQVTCGDIVEGYLGRLDVKYYSKENTGPGLTRNFGA